VNNNPKEYNALRLRPRYALLFAGLALILSFLGVAFVTATRRLPELAFLEVLADLFDLNGEANAPSWYSSLLWLIAATLAFLISQSERIKQGKFIWNWGMFCAACIFLSADEAMMIHERIGDAISKIFKKWEFLRMDRGWLYSWMYWGIGFLSAFLFLNYKFLLALPRRTLYLLCTSGAIFLSGAIGVELFSAWNEHGIRTINSMKEFTLLIAAEKTLEMAGVVALIYTLLDYICRSKVEIVIEGRS
jgi:hypothetical protein